jgi:perosamine synthetase
MRLFKTFICQEAKDNVLRVLDSGWAGMGPETEQFENEFAKYIGAKYAIATNSGTEALRLAVHIASRKTSSPYVVSTPNTFIATNAVLVQNDLYPVFTDIDYKTGNMLLSDAEIALREYNCGILMLVHYGGIPPVGSIYKGGRVGNDLKYACYSFHAVKNMPIGDGGMLVTNDDEVNDKARKLRWFGINKSTYQRTDTRYSWEYDIEDCGYKGHMWDVQAAIGRGQLLHIDEWNGYRKKLVDRYRKNLADQEFPQLQDLPNHDELSVNPNRSSNHLFVVMFKDSEQRQQVMDALIKKGIQYGFHYKANYHYTSYQSFPIIGTYNMERFEQTALTLPLHLELTEEDIDVICNTIQGAL